MLVDAACGVAVLHLAIKFVAETIYLGLCCVAAAIASPLPAPHRAAVDGMDGAFHCLFW